MSILSSIGRIAAEFSAARARHQTERSIRSLPLELQKDIGWPDAFDARHRLPPWRWLVGGNEIIVKTQNQRPAACFADIRQAFIFSLHANEASRAMQAPHDAYEQDA